jgi:hypothetical protein
MNLWMRNLLGPCNPARPPEDPKIGLLYPGGTQGITQGLPGGYRGATGGNLGDWQLGSGGGMLSNSPSLKVDLRDVGFTFFGFLMLSNLPSLNVALWEVGFTFFLFWDNPQSGNPQSGASLAD